MGPGFFADTWAVLETSEIQTVADLRGKRIGIDAFGTAADLALRVLQQQHGMVDKQGYQLVEISSAHQEAMLRAGRIHAAYLGQPFWSMARANGGVRPIFARHDALGPAPLVFLAGRTALLTTHPEAVQDFFEDVWRFWQWRSRVASRAAVAIIPPPSEPCIPVTEYTAQAIDAPQEAHWGCAAGDGRSRAPTAGSRGRPLQ